MQGFPIGADNKEKSSTSQKFGTSPVKISLLVDSPNKKHVQFLENVVDFEKGQNHSSPDSHNPIKISFIEKFAITLTWNGENEIIKTSAWKKSHFEKN